MTPTPPAAARCEACENEIGDVRVQLSADIGDERTVLDQHQRFEDALPAHHALIAQRTKERDQQERFKFAANKRVDELVRVLREVLDGNEWYSSMAEKGSSLNRITRRAEALLARARKEGSG